MRCLLVVVVLTFRCRIGYCAVFLFVSCWRGEWKERGRDGLGGAGVRIISVFYNYYFCLDPF